MSKKLGSIMLVLLLVILTARPVYASEFNGDVLNSVVLVYEDIVLDGERLGYGMGTGFFIGKEGQAPEYFVTNYHVIEVFVEVGGGSSESTLLVLFDQNNAEEAYVVDYDKEKDLAILRLANPTDQRKPLNLEKPGEIGSRVFAVGFPSVADDAVKSTSIYSVNDATVTGGNISRLLSESGTGRRLIQMDASIQGGNSGGPLVNGRGNVIGINTFIVIDDNGVKIESMNYAVSVEELLPLLNRNNVPYELTDGTPQPKFGFPAIIGVGILILAAIIVAAAIAAGKKKAKKEETEKEIPKPVQPQSLQRNAVLCSLASQHSGMRIILRGKQILIGRNAASCQIVFQQGTPGVSGVHCSVSWDAEREKFVLTDMKSSYGTFLMNGQKLSPGIPYYLSAGDSFYLGSRENEIRTELE